MKINKIQSIAAMVISLISSIGVLASEVPQKIEATLVEADSTERSNDNGLSGLGGHTKALKDEAKKDKD